MDENLTDQELREGEIRLRVCTCLLLVGSFFAVQASAHVVFTPHSGRSGTRHQLFSVVAPTEKDLPLVELKIDFPAEWKEAGGQVDKVRLDPLWEFSVDRDEDDWIKSITWTGGKAPADAFIKFELMITLPKLTGMQQIKVFQKYADGSIVAWVEDPTQEGVENPAAGVLLTEGGEGEANKAFYLVLSGLLGGLIGAGLVLVINRKNNYKDRP